MKFGIKELVILVLAVSFAFFYFSYSWTGVRLFAGALLLFFVPFYLFLDSFDLALGEKLIFSFFIGLGIVPLIVYYLSRILISLRVSLFACFVILILGSFLFRRFYKKKVKKQKPDEKEQDKQMVSPSLSS